MLVFRRQSSLGLSNNSSQFEKMTKQYASEKQRYEQVTSSIRTKMEQITPIDDGSSNVNNENDNDNDNDNGDRYSGNKYSGAKVQPRQKQQQQQEEFVAIVGTLEEQETRTAEMEVMAQNVQGLHEVYKDLNELVTDQQEDLNNLENNVNNVHENIQSANVELTQAEKYQKLAREKQCYILLCCFVIIAVIILSTCLPKGGFCHV